jgi:AbrB family looped-hinge helix DNA binding protein
LKRTANLPESDVKITTKGQVTIPAEIRERLGLHPNTEVEFVLQDDCAVIRKARKSTGRGARLVARMVGKATAKRMTTDEIMALTRGE